MWFLDCGVDIPIVSVFDWHKFWFDKADPNETKPEPIMQVHLLKARSVGLEWKNRR